VNNNNQVVANTSGGIDVESSSTVWINSNTIDKNTGDGITFRGGEYNQALYNTIGTDATGNTGRGVVIDESHDGIVSNTIAHNTGGPGVAVLSGDDNTVSTNLIYDDGGIGIDLGNDGVTPDDPSDSDVGPNELQNFPVMTERSDGLVDMTIPGGVVGAVYYVDLYTNPTSAREGRVYVGTFLVTHSATGPDYTFGPPAGEGYYTAIATDPFGNTSEFSDPLYYTYPNNPGGGSTGGGDGNGGSLG
jgi:parallel beta-helix repeat protein